MMAAGRYFQLADSSQEGMKQNSQRRRGFVLAGCLLGAGSWLLAQSPAKPSAVVSALPAAQPTSGVAASAPAIHTEPIRHIQVDYSGGVLAVDATNASLNEILREVGKKTGMKITGNAADDRVFGHYGPSKPAMVLDALLDGTDSNMLLVVDANGKSELILTARRGGATPAPVQNASGPPSEPDENAGQYVAPTRPYQPPTPNGRSVGFVPPTQDGGAPAAGDASDGPKTPQQIYDQLQRQAQQKQAPAPPQ